MFVIHAIANTGGNNYFEIIGNQTTVFPVASYFQIRNSAANTGLYKVAAVAFVNGYTRVTPVAAIPSTVTDGVLNGGVYQIDFSDVTVPGKDPVIIVPASYNTTATSLTLPSRGSFDYGERLVENTVHLLENFAGVNAPANPTVGQQWFDYTNRVMKTYTDGKWSADVNITSGVLTFADPQNASSKVVLTAAEPTGKTATGLTLYPEADVATGQPIFRVLNSAGAVHLAVLRTDSILTDTRFVSTGTGINDFKGTVAAGSPSKALSTGSVLNAGGSIDVFGKVIIDESATNHGLVYRTSGSAINTVSSLWTVKSAHTDAASFLNSDQQVVLLGAINKFFTPVELSSTLKVTGATTLSTFSATSGSISGTLTVGNVSATSISTNTFTVNGALVSNSTGTTLSKPLDAGGQIVTNLPTPNLDSDAATKKYVDDTNYLRKLADVNVAGVTDTQSLIYDQTTQLWVARTLDTTKISGLSDYIKDKAAESIVAGTHTGITPSYNSPTKALSFTVANQTFTATGDATGTATLNWSGTVSIPLTLKASGVTAGTYTKTTVNTKGIVTAGGALTPADIPTLDPSKIVGNYDLANTYKVFNAIDPTAAGDYVTLRYLQNYTFDAGSF